MDWNTVSPQEKFDHIKKVFNMSNLYYCETGEYEPIDWYDYIFHLPNYDQETGLSSGSCEDVSFSYHNYFGSTLITGTQSDWSSMVGGNKYKFGFTQYGTENAPVLYITCEETCKSELHDDLFPDCDE